MSGARKIGGLKKSRFQRSSAAMSGDVSLNITAMADIFTLLLVFLLKSYTSGGMTINPSADVQLPLAGVGDSQQAEALKVEISQNAVAVESLPVAKLQEYRFDTTDLEKNGVSKSLGSALDKERQRQLLLSKSNPDVKPDARIVIIADRKVPYSTLKSVLASASTYGYTDFKLAVFDKNQ